MKKINLSLENKKKQYSILIGNNILEKISELLNLNDYSKIFVVTDEIIKPLFLEKLLSELPADSSSIVIKSGEKEKQIESVQEIWKAMLDAKCDRNSLVINLGGGVVCDMGGFAASTYMRGVDFINIPTTLLAQVDAGVGGKTGIDFADVKNLIGTFYQPKTVIIDINTLKHLPKREFLSGFGEIIKHGLIKNRAYFEKITNKHPLKFSENELVEIIASSCEIKKEIVKNDETENGTRRLLNFGHTVGHAIEALSLTTSNLLLHGEAISIGIVAESKISQKMGFLSDKDVEIIEQSLKNADLPTSISSVKIDDIKNKMLSDKKNDKGIINFVLLEKIGKAIIDLKISDEIVTESLKYIVK